MERSDRQLAATFREMMALRAQMLEQGASPESCDVALARALRAAWPTRDVSEWPYWARVPRCIHCDGYGLVIRTVVNRLGCEVEEGTPCTCQEGRRYWPKPTNTEQDFTAAGKVATKPKGFSRWNG